MIACGLFVEVFGGLCFFADSGSKNHTINGFRDQSAKYWVLGPSGSVYVSVCGLVSQAVLPACIEQPRR